MKTKIGILLFSVLFSSCYTYRQVDIDLNSIEIGEKYSIKTDGSVKWRGRAMQVNDSLIILQTANKTDLSIPISRIIGIRHGKFSLGKTIGLSVGVGSAVVGGITVYSLSQWEIDFGEIDLQF